MEVLLGAGLGLEAVGMIGQGAAASAQAKGQQAVAEYNAKVATQQAAAEQQATLYKQRLTAEAANRTAGTLRANLGASGVVPSEGTPLQLQAQQASQAEIDQLMLGYQGSVAEQQQMDQATLDRLQASIYGKQAQSAMTAGMIGAGTTLLTGFGKIGMTEGWGT
jgi:hypothetical protein